MQPLKQTTTRFMQKRNQQQIISQEEEIAPQDYPLNYSNQHLSQQFCGTMGQQQEILASEILYTPISTGNQFWIFVSNLNENTTKPDITHLFQNYGNINHCEFPLFSSGKSRGFAKLLISPNEKFLNKVLKKLERVQKFRNNNFLVKNISGNNKLEFEKIAVEILSKKNLVLLKRKLKIEECHVSKEQLEFKEIEKALKRVCVMGIPATMDEQFILNTLACFGEIEHVYIRKNEGKGQKNNHNINKNYGFVTFVSPYSADMAIDQRKIYTPEYKICLTIKKFKSKLSEDVIEKAKKQYYKLMNQKSHVLNNKEKKYFQKHEQSDIMVHNYGVEYDWGNRILHHDSSAFRNESEPSFLFQQQQQQQYHQSLMSYNNTVRRNEREENRQRTNWNHHSLDFISDNNNSNRRYSGNFEFHSHHETNPRYVSNRRENFKGMPDSSPRNTQDPDQPSYSHNVIQQQQNSLIRQQSLNNPPFEIFDQGEKRLSEALFLSRSKKIDFNHQKRNVQFFRVLPQIRRRRGSDIESNQIQEENISFHF